MLLIVLAYVARLYLKKSEVSVFLLTSAWVVTVLSLLHLLGMVGATTSSENPNWLADNIFRYYSELLIPDIMRLAVLTLPFFYFSSLLLPREYVKLFMGIVVFACLDLVILSAVYIDVLRHGSGL